MVRVPYVDVLTLKKFADGIIIEVPFTESPPIRLDLVNGEASSWNRSIMTCLAREFRKASLEASLTGEIETWSYFFEFAKARFRGLYDAFSFSLPREKESGEMETQEDAWDRFDQKYSVNVGEERQLYRLIAVSKWTFHGRPNSDLFYRNIMRVFIQREIWSLIWRKTVQNSRIGRSFTR